MRKVCTSPVRHLYPGNIGSRAPHFVGGIHMALDGRTHGLETVLLLKATRQDLNSSNRPL